MVLTSFLGFIALSIFSIAAERGPWWDFIPEGFRLVFSLTLFLVSLVVMAVVVYFAGLVVVGGKRALFGDAIIIAVLGNVLQILFFLFLPYSWLALLLSILVWLLLIKRFYETGWLGAIAVGLLAVVIYLAVVVLIALFFGILGVIIDRFLSPLVLAL